MGYDGHYADGETVAMAEIDFRLDRREFHVLWGRHEACPVAAGDYDLDDDDDNDRVEIPIDDQLASEWLDDEPSIEEVVVSVLDPNEISMKILRTRIGRLAATSASSSASPG